MTRTMICAAVLAALVLGTVGIEAQTRSLPIFEVDKAWPKLPPKYRVGDPSSFAIDAKDNVWLLHRPRTLLKPEEAKMAAPPVVVFDTAGNFIRAWGGEGAGYQWVEREHGIYIDDKAFVWVTGNNCPTNGIKNLRPVADDQILKFTQEGKFVLQIGRTSESKGNADTRNVHRAADVQVHPATNELFVADGYGNRRVAVFDATTGAFKRMWGAFGSTPTDEDNCMVMTPTTFPAGKGPAQFNIVHALRVAKDGTVYVADRENRRVQVFTPQGKFVNQVIKTDTPFARNLALSPDQQWLYVGDGKEIAVVDRKSLTIVGAIKPPGMIGAGHQIATDSKGNLYIAADGHGHAEAGVQGDVAGGDALSFPAIRADAHRYSRSPSLSARPRCGLPESSRPSVGGPVSPPERCFAPRRSTVLKSGCAAGLYGDPADRERDRGACPAQRRDGALELVWIILVVVVIAASASPAFPAFGFNADAAVGEAHSDVDHVAGFDAFHRKGGIEPGRQIGQLDVASRDVVKPESTGAVNGRRDASPDHRYCDGLGRHRDGFRRRCERGLEAVNAARNRGARRSARAATSIA